MGDPSLYGVPPLLPLHVQGGRAAAWADLLPAVVPELIRAGHQVLRLARSDASANVVADMGAEVHPGHIANLMAALAAADGGVGSCLVMLPRSVHGQGGTTWPYERGAKPSDIL